MSMPLCLQDHSVPEGAHFEGDHYETENDYLILTYFRDPRERYDRLTGVTVANTQGSTVVVQSQSAVGNRLRICDLQLTALSNS